MRRAGSGKITAPRSALALAAAGLLALTFAWAQPADDHAVLATVNGASLTEADFQQALHEVAGPRVLVEMIDQALITQAATAAGITASPAMVKMREDSLLAQAGGEAGLQALLAARGLTEERLRRQIRLGVLLDELAEREMKIPDADVEQYYRAHADRYQNGPQVRARLIMTASRENAAAIASALAAGGDFAGLAKALSTDPATASSGGEMGWFARPDYAPAISEVGFRLKKGETSPPFPGPDGWCLLQVEDTRPAGQRPLAEVRGEIFSLLQYQRLPAARQKWLADRRRQVKITIADPRIKAAAERLLQIAPPPGTLSGS
jgi:foldase protein PrsA